MDTALSTTGRAAAPLGLELALDLALAPVLELGLARVVAEDWEAVVVMMVPQPRQG